MWRPIPLWTAPQRPTNRENVYFRDPYTSQNKQKKRSHTSVRSHCNEDRLCLLLWRCHLSTLIKLLGTFSIGTCLFQVTLSASVLGSRHHLHRLCNLLDVLDRLQPERNGLEGGHSSLLLSSTINGQHIASGGRYAWKHPAKQEKSHSNSDTEWSETNCCGNFENLSLQVFASDTLSGYVIFFNVQNVKSSAQLTSWLWLFRSFASTRNHSYLFNCVYHTIY